MFHCLSPHHKCERVNLQDFVRHINAMFGIDYHWIKCLDHDNSRPQPEILLETFDRRKMAIEHKTFTSPPNHLERHNWEHRFADLVIQRLNPQFGDGLYLLEVAEDTIQGKQHWKRIPAYVQSIVEQITNNEQRARRPVGFSSPTPMPWRFGPVSDAGRSEIVHEVGVGVQILSSFDYDAFNPSKRQAALNGLSNKLAKYMSDCTEKFKGYEDCLRVVLLECYGDSFIVNDEDVIELINKVNIPSEIDQIWYAQPEYVSEWDWEVAYERLK